MQIAGEVEEHAKPNGEGRAPQQPPRCFEGLRGDDPGGNPIEAEESPDEKSVGVSGLFLPVFIAKDLTFENPKKTLEPMGSRIDPSGGILPLVVECHEGKNVREGHSLVRVDEVFLLHGRFLL